MAELPEIYNLSQQMQTTLLNKEIVGIMLLQDKCSNVPSAELNVRCIGARIKGVLNRGKWIFLVLDNNETILLSLGMGADVLFFEQQPEEPQKFQIKVNFKDDTGFTIRFWWFGKFLIASDSNLQGEPNTKDIAPHPFEERFIYDYFRNLFTGKKGQIKAFLMDQKNISGIGNMYMHDILFKSKLHPQKKISEMRENDFLSLFQSINDVLRFSQSIGTFAYESDFFGKTGGFTTDCFLVGYKANKPCPNCGEIIVLIKTGSTSSFICPKCQAL